MSQPMIHGMFTGIPLWHGRDGIRIPEFGLAARTFRSAWALESASSEVLGGAGIIGDAIGVAVLELLAAVGTTRGATRFMTGTPSTGAEVSTEVEPCGAERLTVAEVDVSTEAEACAAVVSARDPALSTETTEQLEDTRHLADRGAPAQAPSVATGMVDRRGASPHAEGPASAVVDFTVAEDFTAAVEAEAAVAAVTKQIPDRFLVARNIRKWRDAVCSE
jgi:hypothetical protein